jgi:hypothetical protein
MWESGKCFYHGRRRRQRRRRDLGGWLVVMRLAVTTTISVPDLVALRFGVAGLLLLPVVLRRCLAFDRLGFLGIIVLLLGDGVTYVQIVGVGLSFAPVAHASVLTQGWSSLPGDRSSRRPLSVRAT